ncbi:MAG: hypothetical protein OQK12_17385 [Motiliproteus sp.]|nr:hypothetical protein [Motiliproteus sp.]MCW9054298.1 hypothetical protein [Motiliproteus sp.]
MSRMCIPTVAVLYFLLVSFLLAGLSSVSVDVLADVKNDAHPINGNYRVVAIRNVSAVAHTLEGMNDGSTLIGTEMTFTEDELSFSGLLCRPVLMPLSLLPIIDVFDPMLADIRVPPTDSPLSSGDQRIGKSLRYNCADEKLRYLDVYQVDSRVLVLPWNNGAQYLMAEKPLTEEQIKRLQKQLTDMKFYSGETSGQIDDDTLSALSSWLLYRLEDDSAYRFKRTLITENILDALSVLE